MESVLLDTVREGTAYEVAAPVSIYEAIKNDDWEGLLALYATAVFDAVHSAELARYICGGDPNRERNDHVHLGWSLSHATSAGSGSNLAANQNSFFMDEKKIDSFPPVIGSTSPAGFRSSTNPLIKKLDNVVREVIGAKQFNSYQQHFNVLMKSDDEGMHLKSANQKTPQGLLAPDQMLHSNQTQYFSSSDSRNSFSGDSKMSNEYQPDALSMGSLGFLKMKSSPSSFSVPNKFTPRELEWEKIMWECAAILSNSHPSPHFFVHRYQRVQREGLFQSKTRGIHSVIEKNSDEDDAMTEQWSDSVSPHMVLFEGSMANATPGDILDGGTGSGTAQHLACLLDSPLALAILLVLGINVDSRHTTFRRLAMHEAACADSPNCLSLLMGIGKKFSVELTQLDMEASALPSYILPHCSTRESASAATANFAESDSLFSDNVGINTTRISKIKLPFFAGWNKWKNESANLIESEQNSPERCAGAKKSEGRKKHEYTTSFPDTLKKIWDIIKLVRSGMAEIDAAYIIIDQVGVCTKTKKLLALQTGLVSECDVARSSSSPIRQPLQPPIQRKNNIDGHGNTPLHWASFKNSVRAMDVLLSHNIDINFPAQPSGWTPLHDAAYSNSADAVKRLIAAGALVDAHSHSGATPLCFAAQEDSAEATLILLEAGADPTIRCLGHSPGISYRANNADNNIFHSRFSGYTPLHYCAHYNSSQSARILLSHGTISNDNRLSGAELLEIPDLNEKLPIHVAVARGSSEVLRELLHGGARVETPSYHMPLSPRIRRVVAEVISQTGGSLPVAIPTDNTDNSTFSIVTPVSSPVLRSLLPSQPVSSSKPWNCLSQKSIDACKYLIEEVELNWTPERHALFSPTDRLAVKEVLRVGKRLEQNDSGLFLELWPFVLSFCGRGWFEVVDDEQKLHGLCNDKQSSCNEEEMQYVSMSYESSHEDAQLMQFDLDGTHMFYQT